MDSRKRLDEMKKFLSVMDESIPKSTMYALVQKSDNKIVKKGSAGAMRKLRKAEPEKYFVGNTPGGEVGDIFGGPNPSKVREATETDSMMSSIKPKRIWWENDPQVLMSHIYWLQHEIPPTNEEAFARNWNRVVDQLSAEYPPPDSWENPIKVGGDASEIEEERGINDMRDDASDWRDDELPTYEIVAKWQGDPELEVVDEADDLEEAEYLAREYRMAYGNSASIRIRSTNPAMTLRDEDAVFEGVAWKDIKLDKLAESILSEDYGPIKFTRRSLADWLNSQADGASGYTPHPQPFVPSELPQEMVNKINADIAKDEWEEYDIIADYLDEYGIEFGVTECMEEVHCADCDCDPCECPEDAWDAEDYAEDYDEINLQAFDRDMSDTAPMSDDYDFYESNDHGRGFWETATVFGTDQDGGSREFEIEFHVFDNKVDDIDWPDQNDLMAQGIYYDEEDIISQLNDRIEVTEARIPKNKDDDPDAMVDLGDDDDLEYGYGAPDEDLSDLGIDFEDYNDDDLGFRFD